MTNRALSSECAPLAEVADEADPTSDDASSSLLDLLVAGDEAPAPRAVSVALPDRIDGVVVGRLLRVAPTIVAWPGAPEGAAARAMATLTEAHVGGDVALMFECGDPARPLVMGAMQRFDARLDEAAPEAASEPAPLAERIVVEAGRELVLSCGDASITLTRAGKILIKGAYVSSHATGTQRIRGATVEIN